MRKQLFKWTALFLSLSLLCVGICSCSSFRFVEIGDETTLQPEVTVHPDPPEDVQKNYEYVIVRPFYCSAELKNLCMSLRNYLKSETKCPVSLKTDDAAYEPKENRIYLLIGDTSYALSQKAKTPGQGTVRFLTEGDSMAVYAGGDQLLYIAVEKLLSDCMGKGVLLPTAEYRDLKLDAGNCTRENWSFLFPSYVGGELDPQKYSAGYGISQTTDCSYMQVIDRTGAKDYRDYLKLLESYGYEKDFENEIDGNLYASYHGRLGTNLYAYYIKNLNKVRIVQDSVSVLLSEFNYQTDLPSDGTEFYMFHQNTVSEETFLIHLADNSWIFVDGGVTEVMNADPEGRYAKDIFQFMKEKSNLKDGEKLVISCWYLSHPHRDHFLAFGSLIKQFHSRIDLQRMMANVPDVSVVTDSNRAQYQDCIAAVERYYPDLMYLKVHTGMKVQLADVSIEVLFTQEDHVETWCADVKDQDHTVYDLNNSSLLSKINIAGLTVLELGDGFRADYTLQPYYQINTLACDILKVAHHYYNQNCNQFYQMLYQTGNVKYVLVTHTSNGINSDLKRKMGKKFINGRLDMTYGFQMKNGRIAVEEVPA